MEFLKHTKKKKNKILPIIVASGVASELDNKLNN